MFKILKKSCLLHIVVTNSKYKYYLSGSVILFLSKQFWRNGSSWEAQGCIILSHAPDYCQHDILQCVFVFVFVFVFVSMICVCILLIRGKATPLLICLFPTRDAKVIQAADILFKAKFGLAHLHIYFYKIYCSAHEHILSCTHKLYLKHPTLNAQHWTQLHWSNILHLQQTTGFNI